MPAGKPKRFHLTPEQKKLAEQEILGYVDEVNSSFLAKEDPGRAELYGVLLQVYARRPSKKALELVRRDIRAWRAEGRNWVTANQLEHPELARLGTGEFSGYLTEREAMIVLGVGQVTLRKVVKSHGNGIRVYDPFELRDVMNHELVKKARALIHRRNNPPRKSSWERIVGKRDPFS